jgi:hypothetical protein
MKACTKCGETKPLSEYVRSTRSNRSKGNRLLDD